jgi:hypothetical protein
MLFIYFIYTTISVNPGKNLLKIKTVSLVLGKNLKPNYNNKYGDGM